MINLTSICCIEMINLTTSRKEKINNLTIGCKK